jgi:Family of unknown function (DUF6526)
MEIVHVPEKQNFENHNKFVPLYIAVAAPILVLNFLWSLYRAIRVHSFDTVVAFLLSIALMILLAYSRNFALTVQDRVIRLEMRLRLQHILPADLQARIPALTLSQLVALRFASDAELPELTRKVLAENINDRKAIKKMVRDWQPDDLRA